jgi:hypothetical protein
MSDDTGLAEIEALLVDKPSEGSMSWECRYCYGDGSTQAEFRHDDNCPVGRLLSRVRALAEEAARMTLMRDAAYDKWDEYETKQKAHIAALEAQAAQEAFRDSVVFGRRTLEKMLYAWQDAHMNEAWGYTWATMCGEVRRVRELEDAVLDAALAARESGGKGEDTSDRPMPINWPEGRPLPTEEQARQAVRNAQEMLDRLLEESRKKLPTSAPTRQFTR